MRRIGQVLPAIGVAMGTVLALGVAPEAHKPITSPYTFNEDVFPILRAQCGRCHVAGGVAPMSLMTHADALPWGESIRAELLSGHMPPWSIEGARGRFRHEQVLTARELNILMTWVSGGTPIGNPERLPPPVPPEATWRLGVPDLTLALPSEIQMSADEQEKVAEFTIKTGTREPTWVRAVDVLPGTPAIVRAATVRLRNTPASTSAAPTPEPVLAVWVPGDEPVALDETAAFALPAGAELVVRVLYRKTWEYERRAMTDRSTIGIYFAPAPAPELRALPLQAPPDAASRVDRTNVIAFTRTVNEDLRAVAIYPDDALRNARVTVTAARPDRVQEELIVFRPRGGWTRRYWFAEPIALPRGTTLTVTADTSDPLLPPGALPRGTPVDPSAVRLTLNVLSGIR